MRIGFVTGHELHLWSQAPSNELGHMSNAFFMSQALRKQGCEIIALPPPRVPASLFDRVRERYYRKIRGQRYLRYVEPSMLQALARKVEHGIKQQPLDIVFSNMARYVAKVNSSVPLVTWRDATFAGALEVHRDFRNVNPRSIALGHQMEREALQNAAVSVLRSEWAALSAINYYGADASKVAAVPTGGNIDADWNEDDVVRWIEGRSRDVCKLLFVGVQWEGKGGPLALDIVHELNRNGIKAELAVVGCTAAIDSPYVKQIGFVDKSSPTGAAIMTQLSQESHFLLLPTKVDTFGNVFPEANVYGIPCLAPRLAGIPTIIHNGKNGYTFDLNADAQKWVTCIAEYMRDYDRYRALALSSYREYQQRLSWDVAGRRVKQLLEAAISSRRNKSS